MKTVGSQKFYQEGEAEEILRRALHQSEVSGVDRDRLVSMASELGITEAALARAESDMLAEKEAKAAELALEQEKKAYKKYRNGRVLSDFSSYLVVNAVLVAIWWFTGRHYFWPGWVLGLWGIEVGGELLGLLEFSEKDFQKWRRKQAKRVEQEKAQQELAGPL